MTKLLVSEDHQPPQTMVLETKPRTPPPKAWTKYTGEELVYFFILIEWSLIWDKSLRCFLFSLVWLCFVFIDQKHSHWEKSRGSPPAVCFCENQWTWDPVINRGQTSWFLLSATGCLAHRRLARNAYYCGSQTWDCFRVTPWRAC